MFATDSLHLRLQLKWSEFQENIPTSPKQRFCLQGSPQQGVSGSAAGLAGHDLGASRYPMLALDQTNDLDGDFVRICSRTLVQELDKQRSPPTPGLN